MNALKAYELVHYLHESVIIYGAGNMAKAYIPMIKDYVEITEIWDAFTNETCLHGFPIRKPYEDKSKVDMLILVFVDSSEIREEISMKLKLWGYHKVFNYKDIVNIIRTLPKVNGMVFAPAKKEIEPFIAQNEFIESEGEQVLYSFLQKNLRNKFLKVNKCQEDASNLICRMEKTLVLKSTSNLNDNIKKFLDRDLDNMFVCLYELEILLRKILANGTKTAYRPIRMVNDRPYDSFAVYTALKLIMENLFKNDVEKMLLIIEYIANFLNDSPPVMAVKCELQVRNSMYEASLESIRRAMSKYPNDLLISEVFYQTANTCKEQGIFIAEPLPEYDLKQRFCWSGITFALCSGFSSKNQEPTFVPCFRTMQCAAYPRGEFWTSDEWAEFRKSLLDGTFRYCQKNNCPNLAVGWLPKKSECENGVVRKLWEDDPEIIPPLEELHFSYDFHCNLKCFSCRTEFCTNDREENQKLDMAYEGKLKPLVKSAKHLCLSGCGEALLSPHSRKVLKSLSVREYPELSVELRTNVTSFTPANWETLGDGRKVIKHVAASIDAASKELFEKLRYPAKWDIILNNLRYIQNLRQRGEVELFEFHVVVQDENIEELIDIIKMAIQYDADVVTFSRIVNWRGMSEEEYCRLNPFQYNHPKHERLMQIIREIKEIREQIETGKSVLMESNKKLYINMHCVEDPSERYKEIRIGKLKIR